MKRFPALLLVLAFALPPALSAATPARPNVLFIAVDDLRTSLGCYGDPIVKSPNIDRLAQSARRFNRAYCQQAVCGPSRASILTGRLPDNTGVWHNRNLFRTTQPNLITLPQLFKNNGYHTQSMGKVFSGDEREEDPASWSVPAVLRAEGWKNYALPRGEGPGKQAPFERADVPDEGYSDGKLANLAVETLAKLQQRAQPFFLAVGFFKPHLPFNAPKKYWDLYDPAIFTPTEKPTRTKGAPDAAYPDHLELAGYKAVPKDERVSAEQARDLRHGYYACVSYTDAQIGKVLAALTRLGLDRNTIVVLWADHGYSLGEADHWCKATNFELDTHVPMMIRTPDLALPGTPTEALVEHVDLYPTLAELAGLTPPLDLDGRSLIPILKDPRAPGRDAVLSQFSRPFRAGYPEVMGYSVRTDTQRYTRWIEWTGGKVIAEEFYDYTAPNSVSAQAGFLVERSSLNGDPAVAPARQRLSARLDEMLATRIKRAELPSTDGAKQKKKKRSE